MINTIYSYAWLINDFLSNILLFLVYFIVLPQSKTKLNYTLSIAISLLFMCFDFSSFKYTDLGTFLIIFVALLLVKSKDDLITRFTVWNCSLFLVIFTQGISSALILKFIPSMSNPSTAMTSISLFVLLTFLNYLITLSTLIITKILNRKFHLEVYLRDYLIKKVILAIIMVLNFVALSLDVLTKYLHIQKEYMLLSIAIITITVIFITIAIIMIVHSRIKEMETNLKLKHMAERDAYINELEKNNDELRRFKHDYKNLLLSLSASINDENDKNLKLSIGKLISYENIDLDSDNNKTNLYKLKDKLVKGILVSKIMQAKNQKINTNIEIDDNFNIPPQYSVKITRILGILLDNAIDASLKSNNPEIDIALIRFEEYIEIIIKNTVYSNSSIKLNEIYKSGYTTKENHSGLGLATVRDIVDSNSDFLMQTKNKDGYYSTILTILKGK